MFNYIKWELWSYFRKSLKLIIAVAAIFLLFLIIPKNSTGFFAGLIVLLYSLIIMCSLFLAFFVGAKKVEDTFKNKTFLLESMISLHPKKILLSKYIVATIINLFYVLISATGIFLLVAKFGGLGALADLLGDLIKNIDYVELLKYTVMLFLYTLSFMSIVTLGYIIIKVLFPNSKSNKFIGIIFWFVLGYCFGQLWSSLSELEFFASYPILSIDIFSIIISVISFFITSYLIENKLEIYN